MPNEPRLVRSHLYTFTGANDEYVATLRIERRHGVLYAMSLWTHSAHRNQGFATQLMEAAVRDWGHEDMYLNVLAYTDQSFEDKQLAAWYERFGFVATDFPGGMWRKGR